MSTGYYLGIDGGGTKTGVALVDGEGSVLAEVFGPGSAIFGNPHAAACEVLSSLTNDVLSKAGLSANRISACGIGLNGIDFADEFEMQRNELANAIGFPVEKMTLVNDGIVALWGASPSSRSAILQLGTGITSAYRSKPGRETLFDHLNTGKTLDIRQEFVKVLSRMIDGRVERTPLLKQGLKFFEIDDEERFRELLYRERIPREKIRSTPPILYKAWEEGDVAAESIIDAAIEEYVLAAEAMLSKIGMTDSTMIFGGGVILQAPEAFWQRLATEITSDFSEVEVHAPLLPPQYGAALMGAFEVGEDYEKLFNALEQQREL